MKKIIEVELRALFDPEKHQHLMAFLGEHGEDLGEDDKDTYFFVFKKEKKFLKVVKNLSQGTGKVVLKLGKLGYGHDLEEIEVPIQIDEVDRMAKLFQALELPVQMIHNDQKRHNFIYKGVEIALKYSLDWGYHAELEIVVNDLKDKQKAEGKIRAVAEELGLKLMTEEELLEFTREIEERYLKQEQKGQN